jgi:hypothetical protein
MTDFSDEHNEIENEAEALAIVDAIPDDELTASVPDEDSPALAEQGDEGPDESLATQDQDDEHGPETATEAPGSWKADARELFDQLPPELQREVSRVEAEQRSAYNRRINEATEAKSKAEALAANVAEDRKRYADSINFLTAQSKTYDPILADARQTDWDALARDNPAEYTAKKHAVEKHVATLQNVMDEQQRIAGEQQQAIMADQTQKLMQAIPEWRDQNVAKEQTGKLTSTLQRDYGFTPQEIDTVIDHRLLVLARDAMRYRDMVTAQKTLPEKRSVTAPRVQRPAATRDGKSGKDDRAKALFQRALTTRSDDDMADAILAQIGA